LLTKTVIIIQLIFAFTAVLWIASIPFTGEHFVLKSKMMLYQFILGQDPHSNINAQRFQSLPESKQEKIAKEYKRVLDYAARPFLSKLHDSFKIFFFETPRLELAWILFSILICILLLLRVEGATEAAWILPLIVMGYSLSNWRHSQPEQLPPEDRLYPTEQVIVEKYLKEPLGRDLRTQKEQLTRGWHYYLVQNWSKEAPALNSKAFDKQVQDAEYAFHLARLEIMQENQNLQAGYPNYRKPMWLLLIYLLWNCVFAWISVEKASKKSVLADAYG
jgi:hypothetical protein